MAVNKRYIYFLIAFLLASCAQTKEIKMDQDKEIQFFDSYCAGRYQMKLPIGSQIVSSQLEGEYLHLTFNDKQTENPVGLYFGENRKLLWEKSAEKLRVKWGSEYVEKNTFDGIDLVSMNHLFDSGINGRGPAYMTDILVYKDFPVAGYAISGKESRPNGTLRAVHGTFEQQYHRLRRNLLAEMQLVKHVPWPHNQIGLCLNNQLIVNQMKAYKDELFAVEYKLGEMSFIRFETVAYSPGWKKLVDGQRGPFKSMLNVFANKRVNVAGFDGYLAVTLHPYHREAVKFKWLSSSPKFDTTRFPSIKIRGTININDFPQIADRGKSLDLLMTILGSIQPRENGFVGTW